MSATDNSGIGCLVVLAAIAGAIYVWGPQYGSERTVYFLFCSKWDANYNCIARRPSDPAVYLAIPDTQTVVEDWTGVLRPLEHCTVLSAARWECDTKALDHYTMEDGVLRITGGGGSTAMSVPRYEWLLSKYGR